MKRTPLLVLGLSLGVSTIMGQIHVAGALPSYNDEVRGQQRHQQYYPEAGAFVCENGINRFTRALYGSPTDWRIETSDRPVFAIVKKNHHRHLRFLVNGVALDSTDYCKAFYENGMRRYLLSDHRWGEHSRLEVEVAACPDREGAIWLFRNNSFGTPVRFEARMCEINVPKLKRNGDIGADMPGVFEAAPLERGLQQYKWETNAPQRDVERCESYFTIDSINMIVTLPAEEAHKRFAQAVAYNKELAGRLVFSTPDPYLNTLGSVLAFAADGDWDGQTWLHGCIGWRMPLAGWRAAYAGDVLGWNERAKSHFNAYAKSQVTEVEPTIPHPSQDPKMQLARAEKKWGTQMYSNGYICRNPERNDQMHHYDMNLNYIDELMHHFQYDADTAYMRKMWPVIKNHLAWEKRNYDPDGDHLYDAYCCIWASDALYYSGGAVTHSSAYNYYGNKMAARIAELIGEDARPYHAEAAAIDRAINERLWIEDARNNVQRWAEYQDGMGLKRLHPSAAAWSYYTPVDCGVGSERQRFLAIADMQQSLPHIQVEQTPYYVIATSNWLPYSWSINNVAMAETMHMALACFKAGQRREGFSLLMGSVMDNMYYGQSPANFGQLSHYDAARGECYRDFGDCIGIASRALVEGLFGICPLALEGKCILQPGFPDEWDSVRLKTPYIEYMYTRKGDKIRYEVTQHFRQPLTIVIGQHSGQGEWRYTKGSNAAHQVIEVAVVSDSQETTANVSQLTAKAEGADGCEEAMVRQYGLAAPDLTKPFRQVDLSTHFNAEVDDIYNNQYLSPRPKSTTLQIPVQGVGEWCHPQYKPEINDSVFRMLITDNVFNVAGVPFKTPKEGQNIVYTSLWDNYPNEITLPLKGRASSAYLLMAGSTNHMQSRIDNGLVVVTYQDATTDTLRLRNPENWCPIEQDYFADGVAFRILAPRPYRICLGTGIVSRDLGSELNIKGVYGREITGGAAQMLRMPVNPEKKLKNLTLITLSNDVVMGLMAVTLQ